MDDRTPIRRRTVEWHDPMIGAATMPSLPGIEYLQAMIDGEIPPPPMIALMDMSLDSVAPGTVTFTCRPDESHYSPIGAVHGGFVCTVLDSAAGCAVHTTLPAGTGYTSLEIKVSYLRAVSAASGALTAVGTVTKPGSRVAFAEAVMTDGQGRIVATATSTLLVFPIVA